MKFIKENWYYITEVNGEEYIVQRIVADPGECEWECIKGNWIYLGRTREEAVMNAVNENR